MPASQTAATERRNERMVSIYIYIYPFHGCRFRRKPADVGNVKGGAR